MAIDIFQTLDVIEAMENFIEKLNLLATQKTSTLQIKEAVAKIKKG